MKRFALFVLAHPVMFRDMPVGLLGVFLVCYILHNCPGWMYYAGGFAWAYLWTAGFTRQWSPFGPEWGRRGHH